MGKPDTDQPNKRPEDEVAAADHLPSPEPFPAQGVIGRQLKAFFDGVANEPVPDKLASLLEELERKQGERAKSK